MSFAAQEQLAEGNIARDMQYGGGSKIMQLEAVELQEPAEEWVDWKPKPSQQIWDKAYLVPSRWVRKVLRLLPAVKGGEPGLNGDHIRWREKSLGLQLY